MIKESFEAAESTLDQVQRYAQAMLNDTPYASYTLGNCLGQGGNSRCYSFKDDETIVLLAVGCTGFGTGNTEAYEKLRIAEEGLSRDVQIGRILYSKREDNKAIVVQEKVPGSPLHDRNNKVYEEWSSRLAELASAPQPHFTKLIRDLRELQKAGIRIDPSKPDNCFYDVKKGFYFIDLMQMEGSGDPSSKIGYMLLFTSRLFNTFDEKVRTNDRKNILEIINKLKIADADTSRLEEDVSGFFDGKVLSDEEPARQSD